MRVQRRLMRLAATATVAATLLLSSGASAEYRHRVLVLERANGSDSDREITTRVRAELGAAGFDVMVLPVTDDDPKQAVESAGRELHPASVLLVERLAPTSDDKSESAGAELWLADRMLRKTVVLRLKPEAAEASATDRAGVNSREAARVAVQAVELVKARLAELAVTREHEPPPTPTPSPTPPVAPPPPEPRGPHSNLSVGLGLLKGFQKDQQALTPVVRLGVTLPEHWTGDVLAIDVRGDLVALGGSFRIEHDVGAATVRHTAVGLDAVVRFLPKRRVQPFVSLGGGALVLDVAGDAPDPYRNSSARTLSGLVNASGGVWLQPIRGLGLVLEAQLMDAWSKTVVRIAGEDAAEVAAPFLLMSGGLMVEF